MAAASAPVSLPASDVGSSLASAATGSPVPRVPGVDGARDFAAGDERWLRKVGIVGVVAAT